MPPPTNRCRKATFNVRRFLCCCHANNRQRRSQNRCHCGCRCARATHWHLGNAGAKRNFLIVLFGLSHSIARGASGGGRCCASGSTRILCKGRCAPVASLTSSAPQTSSAPHANRHAAPRHQRVQHDVQRNGPSAWRRCRLQCFHNALFAGSFRVRRRHLCVCQRYDRWYRRLRVS